ncbi:hypothetical protein CK203_108329 [Vitis vinifera]|uniref:Uncharacterized protein n=1 Tax=Vitis vinifera TaxID=29760 RepID=A0A438FFV4_VITVI|nr:hypothetical protein CK203_108329 [Vitis vinifera]
MATKIKCLPVEEFPQPGDEIHDPMMQSVKEKTIKREFEVKEEDVVNDDAFIGGTYDMVETV